MGIHGRTVVRSKDELVLLHIESMQQYAAELLHSGLPWVSRKKVAKRIADCAKQLQHANFLIGPTVSRRKVEKVLEP
jgi:hypothetical protein